MTIVHEKNNQLNFELLDFIFAANNDPDLDRKIFALNTLVWAFSEENDNICDTRIGGADYVC